MNVTADQFLADLRKKGRPCPHLAVAIGNEDYYQEAIKETMKKRIAFDHKGEELNTWTFEDRFNLVDLREAICSQSFLGGSIGSLSVIPLFFKRPKTQQVFRRPKEKAKKGKRFRGLP